MADRSFHKFDFNGLRFKLYYDELYETRGSYAYDTPEETKAAEDEELAKLDSGAWVVFGVRIFEPCPCKGTCPTCDGWAETKDSSVWGIVMENDLGQIELEMKRDYGGGRWLCNAEGCLCEKRTFGPCDDCGGNHEV